MRAIPAASSEEGLVALVDQIRRMLAAWAHPLTWVGPPHRAGPVHHQLLELLR